jgi:quinol monooxygenase YgiN
VITLKLRLVVTQQRRDEVAAVFQSLVGPIRAQSGCTATRFLSELSETGAFTFVEEWRERLDLEQHLRTPAFRKILATMELASEPPTVEVDELGTRRGFEFVEEVLGTRALPHNGDGLLGGQN